MSDEITGAAVRKRVTLDGQLLDHWEREARRLEALAEGARWSWVARRLQRKADRAWAQGAVFAAREAARRPPDGETAPDAS